jgi:hypothetical protein
MQFQENKIGKQPKFKLLNSKTRKVTNLERERERVTGMVPLDRIDEATRRRSVA